MPKIKVSKPLNGVVDLEYDDSRGPTGRRLVFLDVRVEDIQTVLLPACQAYLDARAEVRAIRRKQVT